MPAKVTAQDVARAAGVSQPTVSVVNDLLAHQVDGIILASVAMSSALTDRLRDEGVPMVLFNRGSGDQSLSSVTSANHHGGREVATFLLAGGHRRIAHISGWQGASTGQDRAAGFAAALDEAGHTPFDIIDGMFNRDAAAQAARDLFAGGAKPDAIFVGNDHMAFAVAEVLQGELALSIPGDVSLVGYDDVAMAAWPSFSLTTLRQPANRMVDAVIDALMDQIGGNTAAQHIEIEGPLVIRQSARVPEGWDK